MRLVEIGGNLVEVHVRESERAQRVTARMRFGQPPELVVPRGTTGRALERALDAHREWLARQLATAPRPKLELPALTERELRKRARIEVTAACEREAPLLEVAYRRIAIRDQRTRWGSCSTSGTLSFNFRLALAPPDVLDYVVVHELCHLREPNHSRRFWRLVESARPQYREQKRWLYDHGWELLAYKPAPTVARGKAAHDVRARSRAL